MPSPKVLSAKVSYAVSLYLQLVEKGTEPRAAYAAACELAGLTSARERSEMRSAVLTIQG
jgi:hypothetical protein